jgi:hypothetical protein
VDSSLFSYSDLSTIAGMDKEWRQLAERGMKQLLNLSLSRGGNANLQQTKRVFSEKLRHINLQGSTSGKGMELWRFIKQAFELCPNLMSIDLRQWNGTGLTQAVALATNQRCEQVQGVTMEGGNFYSYLVALKPYKNSEKSLFDGVWTILGDERLGPRILLEDDFVPSGDALSAVVRQKEPDTVAILLALKFRSPRDGPISFTVRDIHILTAARGGATSMVDILVKAGGDVNAVNSEGATPILLVVESGNTQMVNLLHDRGAKMDVLRRDVAVVVALTIIHGHDKFVDLSKQLVGYWGPEHSTANDIRGWTVELVSAFMTSLWIESAYCASGERCGRGKNGASGNI